MATSYNGWEASPDREAINVQPFGDPYGVPFPGGVRGGDVATVLGYVATQLHRRVEACVSGWDWGYEYRENVNNPGSLSCHASATAIDYNAPNHPNGSGGTFSDDQVGQIRLILAEVQGAVQWGGDYDGTLDEMHFEIIVDASTLAAIAAQLPSSGSGTGDWFDMATEDDLRRIVGEEIDARLATIGVAVWTTGINERGAANAMLDQASLMAQSAADQCAQMPTAVWTKGITDDTDAGKANALLAKAANG
jgi:D-alanyl-D-alanine carboxypeptidase